MALDLSPERFGSQAPSEGSYMSGEEIMAEADRLEQVRKDAKIIAQEIIKELEKREEAKEQENPETIPVETTAVVAEVQKPASVNYTLPILSGGFGFLIGILVASLFCVAKIRRIRKEYERW